MKIKWFLAFAFLISIFSCTSMPSSSNEKFNIEPIVGENQRIRINRGNKFIDYIEKDMIISCRCDIDDRAGVNSAFLGNTFVFYMGIENINYPVIEFDENNLSVYGKNDINDNWKSIKRYSANETFQIWQNGKNIMWTLEGQINYISQVNELKNVLLFSNSVYKGRPYSGLFKAAFENFKYIKVNLIINKDNLMEKNLEFIFSLVKI